MAYVYVRKREDAEKIASILTEAQGFRPDIFRDRRGYRVQHNELGSDALKELLTKAGLEHLVR